MMPLRRAAQGARLEVVKLLVEQGGANVESKDWSQRTPLSLAAANGRLEVAEFLVEEAGADVESKDKWGETALDMARRGIREEWVSGDRDGRKAVAAWLEKEESRIPNHGSRANVNDG